jgi:uncharacterized protein (TIGR04255 family)
LTPLPVRPIDLPNFDRPPIDEVAIALQLSEPIPGFTDAHVGLYWQSVKQSYPRVESQPRLSVTPETLDEGPPPVGQTLQMPMLQLGGRTWLVSDDDAFVVQIQNDRFTRNWRRREQAYPHFEALAEAFWNSWHSFGSMLEGEGISIPSVQQVEVTYINWVTDMGMSDFLKAARSAEVEVEGVDQFPTEQTWTARYSVRSAGGMYARLHAQCAPAIRLPTSAQAQPEQGVQFALNFVAPTIGDMTDNAVDERLSRARDVIVRTFTSVTTTDAHHVWGRVQ